MFPSILTQPCIVHVVRASPRYLASFDSKAVVAAATAIYQLGSAWKVLRELAALAEVCSAKGEIVVRCGAATGTTLSPWFYFVP